jgi:hypothetical protein
MKSIHEIFNKPYPLEERKPAQLKLALIFGLVVFLLLFILNPFGNPTDSMASLFINCSVAGSLTFFTIAFVFWVFFPLFPHFFKEERWNIGREIIFSLIIITSIATANIVAGNIFKGSNLSFINWLRMIFYTTIIGIAPATISIVINQARLLKKYRIEVQNINLQLVKTAVTDIAVNAAKRVIEDGTQTLPVALLDESKPISATKISPAINAPLQITIEAENEKDNLCITASSFIAACSADNYVKIFYGDKGKLETVIIRTTLKKVEEQVAAFPNFCRCHRTALVNMNTVKNLSGTAQGYRLHLINLPEAIPVSRNLNQIIKSKLALIHP